MLRPLMYQFFFGIFEQLGVENDIFCFCIYLYHKVPVNSLFRIQLSYNHNLNANIIILFVKFTDLVNNFCFTKCVTQNVKSSKIAKKQGCLKIISDIPIFTMFCFKEFLLPNFSTNLNNNRPHGKNS